MLETGTMAIERRKVTNSNANKKIRRTGYLPGVISSKGKESISVALRVDELRKGITNYGRNALFDLKIEDKKICTTMIKDIQFHPVKGDVLHVDFQEVFHDEEIKAEVGMVIKGTEMLENKRLFLMRQMDLIPVKGLPQDIPENIEFDVSSMEAGEVLKVEDLEFPKGIEPDCNLDRVVVTVTA